MSDKVRGCSHGVARETCVHCAARCEVCGFRLDVVSALFGWLSWRQKQYRWPKRKRIGQLCPECSTVRTTLTQLARDVLEVA